MNNRLLLSVVVTAGVVAQGVFSNEYSFSSKIIALIVASIVSFAITYWLSGFFVKKR